jgi:hypothetical protein
MKVFVGYTEPANEIELAHQYWQMSVAAHHGKATRMKYDAMDEHFAMVDIIAKVTRPELWDGSEV